MSVSLTGRSAPRLRDDEFTEIRDFFYQRTGIFFGDTKRYFVDKRIFDRMSETGHRAFRDYFRHARFGANGRELEALISALTVNETYFFREKYQFDCLIQEVLPELTRNRARSDTIRIWSIPSSTGEEPYSIVLHLLEDWPGLACFDVEIYSSDIDQDVLQACNRGIYSARAVAKIPPPLRQKYFEASGPDFELRRDIRESVTFSLVNVTDSTHVAAFRDIDVVFCRNLFIYFDDRSRERALANLYGCLRPGGYLFLGHSESLARVATPLLCRQFRLATAYQRPANDS